MPVPGALLPYRSDREREVRARKDALAKPSGGARYLRNAAFHRDEFGTTAPRGECKRRALSRQRSAVPALASPKLNSRRVAAAESSLC